MTIVHDATTTATAGTASTTSHSHTVGSGSDRLMLVNVGAEDNVSAAIQVSTLTYNGVNLTKVVGQIVGSGTLANAEIWDLRETDMPSSGSYTVAVTMGSTITAIMTAASTYTGVEDQVAEATNSSSNSSSSTSHSTVITTVTNNAWAFDCFAGGTGSTVSADTGQTENSALLQGSATAGTSTEAQPTAGSTTLGWTYASVNRVAHVLVAYEAAAGGAGATGKSNPLLGPLGGCLSGVM